MNGRDFKSMAAAPMVEVTNATVSFAQEAFSEYHLYSLNRRTSIFDQESKQISLLNASHFPVRKVYVVNGQSYYYRSSRATRRAGKRSGAGLLQIQE